MKKDIYLKVIITTLCLIILTCFLGYIYFQKTGKSETITGKVIEIRSKYIMVTDEKENDYMIETREKFEKGQIIEAEITNIKEKDNWTEGKAKSIKKLLPPEENIETKEEPVTENTSNHKIETTYEEKTTSSENKIVSPEEDVITYFEEEDNLLTNYKEDRNLKQRIKDGFVTIIDFLFYDGTIKGKKFSDLSSTAKLKVLKLFFFIDEKVENHFPEYKEELGKKYESIKEKAIEKYLDTTVKVCENNEETCNSAKSGFKDLKEKFKITWDIIKDISGSGLSKLKNWYEIYRAAK